MGPWGRPRTSAPVASTRASRESSTGPDLGSLPGTRGRYQPPEAIRDPSPVQVPTAKGGHTPGVTGRLLAIGCGCPTSSPRRTLRERRVQRGTRAPAPLMWRDRVTTLTTATTYREVNTTFPAPCHRRWRTMGPSCEDRCASRRVARSSRERYLDLLCGRSDALAEGYCTLDVHSDPLPVLLGASTVEVAHEPGTHSERWFLPRPFDGRRIDPIAS